MTSFETVKSVVKHNRHQVRITPDLRPHLEQLFSTCTVFVTEHNHQYHSATNYLENLAYATHYVLDSANYLWLYNFSMARRIHRMKLIRGYKVTEL